MTGLVLKLRPKEKMLLNGVLIQNGDRAAQLRIQTNKVSILRLRDALHPDEATTPVRKIYYVAQLAIAGEATNDDAQRQILEGLILARRLGSNAAHWNVAIARAEQAAQQQRFFAVMRIMKSLMIEETAAQQRSDRSTDDPDFN